MLRVSKHIAWVYVSTVASSPLQKCGTPVLPFFIPCLFPYTSFSPCPPLLVSFPFSFTFIPVTPMIIFHKNECFTYASPYNFGDRAFSAAGPPVWNYLPTVLRQPDLSYSRFGQSLVAFLFGQLDQSTVWIPLPRFNCFRNAPTYLFTSWLNRAAIHLQLHFSRSVECRLQHCDQRWTGWFFSTKGLGGSSHRDVLAVNKGRRQIKIVGWAHMANAEPKPVMGFWCGAPSRVWGIRGKSPCSWKLFCFWIPNRSSKFTSFVVFCKLAVQTPELTDPLP